MAFVTIKGQTTVTNDLGYGIVVDVVQAHAAFLQEFGLTNDQVPLVELDQFNWNEPFAMYRHAG